MFLFFRDKINNCNHIVINNKIYL